MWFHVSTDGNDYQECVLSHLPRHIQRTTKVVAPYAVHLCQRTHASQGRPAITVGALVIDVHDRREALVRGLIEIDALSKHGARGRDRGHDRQPPCPLSITTAPLRYSQL